MSRLTAPARSQIEAEGMHSEPSSFLVVFTLAAGAAALIASGFYFGAIRFVELSSCGAC